MAHPSSEKSRHNMSKKRGKEAQAKRPQPSFPAPTSKAPWWKKVRLNTTILILGLLVGPPAASYYCYTLYNQRARIEGRVLQTVTGTDPNGATVYLFYSRVLNTGGQPLSITVFKLQVKRSDGTVAEYFASADLDLRSKLFRENSLADKAGANRLSPGDSVQGWLLFKTPIPVDELKKDDSYVIAIDLEGRTFPFEKTLWFSGPPEYFPGSGLDPRVVP